MYVKGYKYIDYLNYFYTFLFACLIHFVPVSKDLHKDQKIYFFLFSSMLCKLRYVMYFILVFSITYMIEKLKQNYFKMFKC